MSVLILLHERSFVMLILDALPLLPAGSAAWAHTVAAGWSWFF